MFTYIWISSDASPHFILSRIFQSDGYTELGVRFKLPSCLCPFGAACRWPVIMKFFFASDA